MSVPIETRSITYGEDDGSAAFTVTAELYPRLFGRPKWRVHVRLNVEGFALNGHLAQPFTARDIERIMTRLGYPGATPAKATQAVSRG